VGAKGVRCDTPEAHSTKTHKRYFCHFFGQSRDIGRFIQLLITFGTTIVIKRFFVPTHPQRAIPAAMLLCEMVFIDDFIVVF
jgi:hypothetical protein